MKYLCKGSGSQQSGNSQESGLAQLHHRLAFLNPWRNKDDGSDSGTADMRGVDTSPGKGGFDLPGRSTSPVGSATKRTRAKEPRGNSSAKRRRMGLPVAAGSYKGSYKMEDSFSSSDESGQEEERAKAAAGVRPSILDRYRTLTISHLSGENHFYRETYDKQPEAIRQ